MRDPRIDFLVDERYISQGLPSHQRMHELLDDAATAVAHGVDAAIATFNRVHAWHRRLRHDTHPAWDWRFQVGPSERAAGVAA